MSHREEARRRAEASYAITLATCQRAVSSVSPDQVVGSSQYAGSGSVDSAGRQRALDARDQLGHFRGEVYTSVRPIMERMAGRPIRVARVAGRGKKKGGSGKVPSFYLQKWFAKSSLLAGGAEPREVEILDQHPLLDAVHTPAPSIVGWSNWHLKLVSVASLCTTGYAYWWFPVVNGRTEIWYLPPDWVWPVNTKDKLNVAWEIRPLHGEKHEVPREEIAPFWFPDPANPLQGLGPLEAGGRGVLISEFLEECQKRHFQLGPHPTAIVTLGGQQTKDGKSIKPRLKQWQLNQIRDAFDMRYANVFNAGRTVVLDALIDKFEPWSNTPHTMSYGENADSARKRVRQSFGTSDYAVGEGSLGSRAESAEADYHFVENTLLSKCELFSRTMTLCVLPVFDNDPSLIAFLEPPEPHDHDRKATAYDLAVKAGVIPINDYLVDVLGKEPVPHGNNYLVPTSYTVRTPEQMTEGFTAAPAAGAPGAPGLLPAPQQPAPGDTGASETPEDQDEPLAEGEEPKSAPALKKNFAANRDSNDFRRAYIDTWLKTHGGYEQTLAEAMLAFQGQQAEAVVKSLGDHYGESDGDKLRAMTDARSIAATVFNPQSWLKGLKHAVRQPLTHAWLAGASHEILSFPASPDSSKDGADIGFDFDLDLPPDVKTGIAHSIDHSLAMPYWGDIEQTKLDDLGNALKHALDDGKPMRDIIKDVRGVFSGDMGRSRAENIARTEITGAMGAGAQQARLHLADEGIVDGKEWLDTADSRTRSTHLLAGGQKVGVRDKFLVGGYECDHPGDPALPAKERCRCRCAATSVTGFEDRGQPSEPESSTGSSGATESSAPKDLESAREGFVVHRPGTSDEFKDAVNSALSLVRQRVRDEIALKGGTVTTSNMLVDVRPDLANQHPRGWPEGATWENVDGVCLDFKNAIVAETRLSLGSHPVSVRSSASRTKYVTLHELGHAWDGQVARLSRDADFLKAYQADILAQTADLHDELFYFRQAGDAGPEESVAEGFALVHGARVSTDVFQRGFPRALNVLRDKLGMK
jgi:hypothetical protein